MWRRLALRRQLMIKTAVTPAMTGMERLSTGMPATLSKFSESSLAGWAVGRGAEVAVAPVRAPLALTLSLPTTADGDAAESTGVVVPDGAALTGGLAG